MSNEAGFYHPDYGYWQVVGASDAPITVIVEPGRTEEDPNGETITIPAVTRQSTQIAELLASYPEGTVQVPLKPGADYEWDGEAWVYVEPAPVVPQSVSRRQIITGLGLLGWITEQEAIDALATGARPAAVSAVINQLPQEEQFPATMKWIGFQTAYRDDSMVLALAAVAEKSEQDVDEFFLFCSQIN